MKYYDDDYDAEEAYPTKDETVRRPEIQLESLRGLDWLIALALAAATGGLLTLWAFPGLSPDAWNDAAIGAGLRPMEAIFPGFWNAIARALYSSAGVATGTVLLTVLGRVVAGMTVGLVYLLLRQILSITIRVRLQFSRRRFFVVRGVALLGALFFACSDPVWRAGQAFTPPLLLLFITVLVLALFFGFLMSGKIGQIYLSMFLLGLLSAETPMGFFLLALVWGVYLLALRHGAVAADSPLLNPVVEQSSKWHLTFLYAIGLVLGVAINCTTFVLFDGLAVFTKVGADVPLMYATQWWTQFIHAASGMGWVLGLGIGVLPFVVSAILLPRAVDEEQFLPYHMGAVFFVTGAVAFAQLAELPPLWFWTWSREATINSSYFLLVLMLFSAASVVFALAVMAVDICCRDHQRLAMQRFAELKEDADAVAEAAEMRDMKPLGAGARIVLVLVPLLLLAGVVPGRQLPQTRRMLGIIDDYVKEVLAECGDVKWIFTNGPFNPILELEAAAASPSPEMPLRALSMMSGGTPREQYIRTHGVKPPDEESATVLGQGAPVALHTWASSRPDLMPHVATQIGFEIWKKRLHVELPPCSGLVSRPAGMTEEDRLRGVEAANALAERVLAVYKEGGPPKSAGRKVNSLFRIVQWHIARLATMRAERADHAGQTELALKDKTLADELDNNKASLLNLRKGLDQTEALTMRVITPRRGLMMSLDQADFTQARRYAELILKTEPDNTHANFAMGMSYYVQRQWGRAEEFFRRYLTKKEDAAVLNNLAIVCMETDRYDEALSLANKALKLLPKSGEIKETIADIKKRQAEAAKKADEAKKKAGNAGTAPQPPAADTAAVKQSSPEPAAKTVPPPAAAKPPVTEAPPVAEKKPAPAPAADKPSAPVLRMAPSPREEMDAAIGRGDYAAAAQYAKAILSITPDDPYANFAVGMDHFGKRAWDPAERHLRKCVKQKPDEAVFLNNLAVVLLYRGRYDEALTHARRALKILPGSKDVQDTIRQIEKARDADGAKKTEAKPAPKKKPEAKPASKKKPEAKKPEAKKKPEPKKPEAEKPEKPPENPPGEEGPDALVPALPAAPETM